MTPLALFAFNRPQHVNDTLSALSRCARIDECEIYIYCDGPRNSKDDDLVKETRKIVKHWSNMHQATAIFRSENLGLAKSIYFGVSELCARYGKIIVLEDDLIVSPDFLEYMLEAITRYEFCAQVLQISGFMFDLRDKENCETSFLPLSTTWGWATWQRAWNDFDLDTQDSQEILSDEGTRNRFDLDGSYPFSRMLEQRLRGNNDSWGILWWKNVFQSNGLVLYPARSLVWVGGFDGTGTHHGRLSGIRQPSLSSFHNQKLDKPLQWPKGVKADFIRLNKVKAHLNWMYRNHSRKIWPLKVLRGIKKQIFRAR